MQQISSAVANGDQGKSEKALARSATETVFQFPHSLSLGLRLRQGPTLIGAISSSNYFPEQVHLAADGTACELILRVNQSRDIRYFTEEGSRQAGTDFLLKVQPSISQETRKVVISGQLTAQQITPEMRDRLSVAAYEYNHNERDDDKRWLNQDSYCDAVIADIQKEIERNAKYARSANIYPVMLSLLVDEHFCVGGFPQLSGTIPNTFVLNADQRQAVENFGKAFDEYGLDLDNSHISVDLTQIETQLREELKAQLHGEIVSMPREREDSLFLFPQYNSLVKSFLESIRIDWKHKCVEIRSHNEDETKNELHLQIVRINLSSIMQLITRFNPITVTVHRYMCKDDYLATEKEELSASEPTRDSLWETMAEISEIIAIEQDFWKLDSLERAVLAKVFQLLHDKPWVKVKTVVPQPDFERVEEAEKLVEALAPYRTPYYDLLWRLRNEVLTEELLIALITQYPREEFEKLKLAPNVTLDVPAELEEIGILKERVAKIVWAFCVKLHGRTEGWPNNTFVKNVQSIQKLAVIDAIAS